MSKPTKNKRTEFNWMDKTDHPIDYKELDKENKAFWIEQKKPKRKKMDDSKNGDYFLFCRNKKCNQPIYKNRSRFDTDTVTSVVRKKKVFHRKTESVLETFLGTRGHKK